MKLGTKGSVVRISLLLLSILAVFAYVTFAFDYRTVSIVNSPDNNFKVYHVDSNSEGGAAPYGTHIFIKEYIPKEKEIKAIAQPLRLSWTCA